MSRRKKIQKITICTSATFYRQANKIKKELVRRGFQVTMPHTAELMDKTRDYKVSNYKIWYKDPRKYSRKTYLMRRHFQEISRTDAILVVNLSKNGQVGYIGGNVLMEMGLGFYLKKPIYLWNQVKRDHLFYEEIRGMKVIVMKRDLNRII